MMEFLEQRAHHRKGGRLLAALFFREQIGERLQMAVQRAVLVCEALPMRVRCEHRLQNLCEDLAAGAQRADDDVAAARDDFYRRSHRTHIPARISTGKLITRRKIDPALRVHLLQQPLKAATVRHVGNRARDADAAWRGVGFRAHTAGVFRGYHYGTNSANTSFESSTPRGVSRTRVPARSSRP